MADKLIPITVTVKPFVGMDGTRCLFDVYTPEDSLDLSLYFIEAIKKYPVSKYEWDVHYDTYYVSCDYDKSSEKQLCKLITKE